MDTLERLARLIRRRRDTQGECCHLFIAQNTDNSFAGYKELAELLRAGYFSTIVTANADTRLEQALHAIGPFPPAYEVFTCGRESDEDICTALDVPERGIRIIKLPMLQIGSYASDIWKSLINYLKGDIIILGSINGVHDDLVQVLIAERESNLYYILPAEFSDDRLLSYMRQKQTVNFLIYEHNGLFANFLNELAGQLLQKGPLISQYDTITTVGQRDSSEGEATDAFNVGDLLPPMVDQILTEDEESKTEPLPAIAPSREKMEEPVLSESDLDILSGPLEDGADSVEDRPIKSGPLESGSLFYDARNAIKKLFGPGRVHVLLVTATSVELKAVLSRYPGHVHMTMREKTYFDLGHVGRARTIIVQANDIGPIEANATVDEGIRVLSPDAVIMTGIAFGVRTKGQQIGDVLISKLIHDYDSERLGTDEHNQLLSHQRGIRVMASGWLIDRFNAGNHDWPSPPEIHFGSILSGSKLIDNKEYQTALLRSAQDAIGGEMEGVGLYKAAERHKVHWLLVKGISDWGDGTKGENKAENQRLAAENAAKFVLFVIGREGFMQRS